MNEVCFGVINIYNNNNEVYTVRNIKISGNHFENTTIKKVEEDCNFFFFVVVVFE